MLKAWHGTNIAKRIPVNEIGDIQLVLQEYARIFPEHLPHGVKAVLPAKVTDDFFMATDGKGIFKIAEVEHKGFNSYRDLLGSFSAIKNNQRLTQHQEYALEMVWHEICHNRQRGGDSIKKLAFLDPRKQLMEAVNQLVSRLSYGGFVEKLGGRATHQEWVLKNGYGYQSHVNNLNALFAELGMTDSIKGDLFNINFNHELIDIHALLSDAIIKKTVANPELINRLLTLSVTNAFKFNQAIIELKHPI